MEISSEEVQNFSIFAITYNMHGEQPPEDISALLPKFPTDLVLVGTSECGRSIAQSFVISDKSSWEAKYAEALGPDYEFLHARTLMAIHLMVFRKKSCPVHADVLRSEVVATGLGNVVGNKGGVIITLEISGCVLSIIACHLEAHQHNSIKRTQQFETILRNAMQDNPDSIVFMGDFNFRVHLGRHEVERMLRLGDHQELLNFDEWTNLMEGGVGEISDFRELPITFAPTYKLDVGTCTKYDSSSLARIPSWTDRVLFWSKKGTAQLRGLAYDSVKTVLVSDHLPVMAMLEIPLDASQANDGAAGDSVESKVCALIVPNIRIRVAFIHLDLGIGGAEALIVSAAEGLQSKKHEVKLFTAHCDTSHAFKPVQDKTLDVEVIGGWIPRTIFNKFTVLLAVLRMVCIVFVLFIRGERFDVVINDQVSAINPLLALIGRKSIFYCHYPDAYLCVERRSVWKRMYRAVFDWVERFTVGSVDVVLVNSLFTASVLQNFESGVHAAVLYPPSTIDPHKEVKHKQVSPYFLSLNRYERKKAITVAVEAFAEFVQTSGDAQTRLVIAGGYDKRVVENVEHLEELKQLAKQLKLSDRVEFVCSVSDERREALLSDARALIYTPSREHFGIVPCEAMALGTPVVACNDGGPKETVLDGQTGFLCEPGNYFSFAAAMRKVANLTPAEREKMAMAGRARVRDHFSKESFVAKLDRLVRE